MARKRKRSRRATRLLEPRPRVASSVTIEDKAATARARDIAKLRAVRAGELKTAARNRRSVAGGTAPDLSILSQLPHMQLDKVLGVWRNAIRLLASDVGPKRDAGARAVHAIEKEWRRRRLKPLNPEDYFSWPSTEARGGDGQLSFASSLPEGMLTYLEYRVGRTRGEVASVRRATLDRVFAGHLPPVFPEDYMRSWADPGTSARLHKIAEAIAAFCRNAKRNDPEKLRDAIRDWESDLRYLYDVYYVAKFHFGWPITSI